MTTEDIQAKTSQMDALLKSIQEEEQTGRVNLERSKGGVHETGTILFLYGRAVAAQSGGRNGLDALQWLQSWSTCRYTFHAQSPTEVTASLPTTMPTVETTDDSQGNALNYFSQFLPRRTGRPDEPNTNFSNNGTQTASTGPFSQPLPPTTPRVPQTPPPPPRVPTPRRLIQGPEALGFLQQLRLTRLHRHIFLLLDGQRTAGDLARLTGHTAGEIQQLLTELEFYGLIKIE